MENVALALSTFGSVPIVWFLRVPTMGLLPEINTPFHIESPSLKHS
jgi:hypothetical protein